jgi:predicted RNA-binding protein Jag
MELATHPDVATESVGIEPERYLVVRPYPWN